MNHVLSTNISRNPQIIRELSKWIDNIPFASFYCDIGLSDKFMPIGKPAGAMHGANKGSIILGDPGIGKSVCAVAASRSPNRYLVVEDTDDICITQYEESPTGRLRLRHEAQKAWLELVSSRLPTADPDNEPSLAESLDRINRLDLRMAHADSFATLIIDAPASPHSSTGRHLLEIAAFIPKRYRRLSVAVFLEYSGSGEDPYDPYDMESIGEYSPWEYHRLYEMTNSNLNEVLISHMMARSPSLVNALLESGCDDLQSRRKYVFNHDMSIRTRNPGRALTILKKSFRDMSTKIPRLAPV